MKRICVMAMVVLLAACVEDVGKDKVKAKVEDVPAAKVEAPAPAPAGDAQALKIDASKSSIRALGAKVTATHPVDFKDFTGTVELKGADVAGLTFEVTMATLESDHPKLTEHLKAEDFLHVSEHPNATFKAASVTAGSEAEGMTHTVAGDLTIRGKTKRLTFPAKIEVGDAEEKASTEFTINRQDFDVSYPGRADDLVQDNVVMTISFVAPKA